MPACGRAAAKIGFPFGSDFWNFLEAARTDQGRWIKKTEKRASDWLTAHGIQCVGHFEKQPRYYVVGGVLSAVFLYAKGRRPMNDQARATQVELENLRTAVLLAGATPEAAESLVRARVQQLLPPHLQNLEQTDYSTVDGRIRAADHLKAQHAIAMQQLNQRDEQRRISSATDANNDTSDATGMRSFLKTCF